MSDGPHKTLPMSRKWKRFAECAYNEAYSPEQACDALLMALSEGWRKLVPKSLVDKVQNALPVGQTELFCGQNVQQLESLCGEMAGYPLAGAFLDCFVQAREKGFSGEGTLLEATRQVLTDRLARRARQVEEHYYSEAICNGATDVRRRIEEAIGGLNLATTARGLLGIVENERPQIHVKQTGLDDGVLL